jgi:hypothetical protein
MSYGSKTSGQYVRDEAVLENDDFIAQPQLALLHAGEKELIGLGQLAQRQDRAIQIAMLDTKMFQSLLDFFHRQHRLASSSFRPGRHHRIAAASPQRRNRSQQKFMVDALCIQPRQ